jgi:hypothetical protein
LHNSGPVRKIANGTGSFFGFQGLQRHTIQHFDEFKLIDDIFEKAPKTTKPLYVWRGFSLVDDFGKPIEFSTLENFTLSTSLSPAIARTFGQNLIRILIPPGSKVVYLDTGNLEIKLPCMSNLKKVSEDTYVLESQIQSTAAKLRSKKLLDVVVDKLYKFLVDKQYNVFYKVNQVKLDSIESNKFSRNVSDILQKVQARINRVGIKLIFKDDLLMLKKKDLITDKYKRIINRIIQWAVDMATILPSQKKVKVEIKKILDNDDLLIFSQYQDIILYQVKKHMDNIGIPYIYVFKYTTLSYENNFLQLDYVQY